ncbi:MAG: DNA/RNA helicase domain-containing protein [Thermomicrobiales bacterium]
MLVLSRGDAAPATFEKIIIVYRHDLGAQLAEMSIPESNAINLQEWLSAPYVALPSLVTAARTIFEHQPLPSIRRAQSAGIPQALAALQQAATTAKNRGQRHLALVTGVPGAGKTLVGLQFVYESGREDSDGKQDAIFLSGNGPLVQVLQYVLESKVFVRDVHGFLKQHGGSKKKTPTEHIWVYDEAQRAWDVERVRDSRPDGFSEPEDFVRLADRMADWGLVVGLIGEGQEINKGEESGLIQWNDAIGVSEREWFVHAPRRLASLFDAAHVVIEDDALDLTESLRSHLAQDIPRWIVIFLDGQFDDARKLMNKITEQGFDAYVTRDLATAKNYLRQRYADQESKRYGLLASSKASSLDKYGINREFMHLKRVPVDKWYGEPPSSPDSCCQLREVATEFSCQGLELDFPLVCWGDDLLWKDAWISKPVKNRRDPHQLKLNAYRVLLSRGRDGFIVWVPPEDKPLDDTYDALVNSGLRVLD